jgi:four helix bundle protein
VAGARDHVELDAWKLADQVRDIVDRLLGRPAFNGRPKLREQLREAAESPCPNIAEGFSRYFPRDFARFLRIAKGSLNEVIEHSYRAKALNLITEEEFNSVRSLARRARGAITQLVLYLETAEPPPPPRHRPRRDSQGQRTRNPNSGTPEP